MNSPDHNANFLRGSEPVNRDTASQQIRASADPFGNERSQTASGQLASSAGAAEQAGCLTGSSAWSGDSFGERHRDGDGAHEKCMISHGQAEIDWDQLGRSSYDRTHAEL